MTRGETNPRGETMSPPPLPKVVSYSDAPAQDTRVLQRNHASAVSKVVVLLSVFLSLFVCVSIILLIQNASLRREISVRVESELEAQQKTIDAALEESERIADSRIEAIKAIKEETENERLELEKELHARRMADEERLAELERRQALAEAAKQRAEELERKRLEEIFKIAVAKLDITELLNVGRVDLKATLVSPFGESRKHIYFDELRGAAINLNSRNSTDVGRSEFTREIRIDSVQPLLISVMPRLKDNFLKDEAETVQRAWSKLRAEIISWNKKFPTSKLVLDLPGKKDDFHPFRQRLSAWEIRHSELSDQIDEVVVEVSGKQTGESYRTQLKGLEEARSQLHRIQEHYISLIKALDAVANETVYDSGPVFYTSDGNDPIILPGIKGREPFQFKYTIECPVSLPSSTPAVIPESKSPFTPQGPPLP